METNASELLGVNIFPFPYVPEQQSEVLTYICLDIYVPKVKDKLFKDIQILVNIFSHKDQKSYKGNSRVDLLNIEIDKILNGNPSFGISEVELVSMLPYSPNVSFFGKQIIYHVENFNQRRCKLNEHAI